MIIDFKPVEPEPVEIKLPSKGIPYHKNDVTILVRPITAQEEKILASGGENALDRVLERVIKSDIDIQELTAGDESAILVWLRINSYFDDYKVNLICPSCKVEFSKAVKVSKFPITELKDGIEEPYEVEIAGKMVGFGFLRKKDEKELEEIKKQLLKTKGDTSDLYLYRYAKAIKSIDGEEINFKQALSFISSLLGRDMAKVRKAMADMKHGVEPTLEIKCPNCSVKAKYDIPLTAEFFLPTDDGVGDGEDLSADEEV